MEQVPTRRQKVTIMSDEQHNSTKVLVVNRDAGVGQSPDDLFPGFMVLDLTGFEQLSRDDLDSKQVVAVWGGDGTARSVAARLLGSGVAMLAAPGGTHNHFAHAAGLVNDRDVEAAITRDFEQTVDVGQANGHVFLNTASMGWYADLVAHRERLQKRLPRRLAKIVAFVMQASRVRRIRVEIDEVPSKVWALWIGNGQFSLAPLSLAAREDLEDGILDVRLLGVGRRIPKLRAALAILVGRGEESPMIDRRLVRSCVVKFDNTPTVRVALDGELVRLSNPITFTCTPNALRIRRAVPIETAPAEKSTDATPPDRRQH